MEDSDLSQSETHAIEPRQAPIDHGGVAEADWLAIALTHLDAAATALRQHGDEYRAQLIEAGAYAIRQGSSIHPDAKSAPVVGEGDMASVAESAASPASGLTARAPHSQSEGEV